MKKPKAPKKPSKNQNPPSDTETLQLNIFVHNEDVFIVNVHTQAFIDFARMLNEDTFEDNLCIDGDILEKIVLKAESFGWVGWKFCADNNSYYIEAITKVDKDVYAKRLEEYENRFADYDKKYKQYLKDMEEYKKWRKQARIQMLKKELKRLEG